MSKNDDDFTRLMESKDPPGEGHPIWKLAGQIGGFPVDGGEPTIKELAAVIASMDLEELAQGYRRRLLILDSQIESLRQEREALAEERRKLRAEREQLHALYKINLQVLNIINTPGKAGEKAWQGKEKNSNPSHLLNGFAKSGS